MVEYNKIDPRNIVVTDGFNSRVDFGDLEELAGQIKVEGVLNPITVQETEEKDKYTLVDGERRYRAVMKLISEGVDIKEVRANVLPMGTPKSALYIQQAMRNEGKNFTEYEYALLAQKMIDECGMSQAEIAKRLNKNPGQVTYWLEILKMPKMFQELLRDNVIGAPNLRRILKTHRGADGKYDYESAWDEVEKLLMKMNEEHKISLKNLNFDSKTKVVRDTKALRKGLDILIEYATHYKQTHGGSVSMDIGDILNQLKAGKFIDEIFDGVVSERVNAA